MHGLTTAFEFPNEKGCNVNVMVNDVGDNGDFGPDRINSEDDLRILQNAEAVAVVNWASNLHTMKGAAWSNRLCRGVQSEIQESDWRW